MRSKSDLTHSMASARKELETTLTSLLAGLATLQPRLALSWHEQPTKPEASTSSDLLRTRYLVIVRSGCDAQNVLAIGKSPTIKLDASFNQVSIRSEERRVGKECRS